MKVKLVLGIDTSCYTTSVAAVDLENNLIGEHRQLLKVPAGERGLQQSQAVFQHIQNLPEAISKLLTQLPEAGIAAVAASTRPRPWEGSYMPVFIVSGSQGRILAQILRVPFWESSHQEGHLLAGLWSCGKKIPDQFLAVHLSGGTSEILRVTYLSTSAQLELEILGGTKDLHAGQFIDRIGVQMGLAFPAGPSLEKLAQSAKGKEVRIPSSVDGSDFSFSGSETHARRLLEQGTPAQEVARAVEICIAKTLEKALRHAMENTGLKGNFTCWRSSCQQIFTRKTLSPSGTPGSWRQPVLC
ncbi:MAG: O-sialoglycoprotein endopeptidase [Bacillota bacterium]